MTGRRVRNSRAISARSWVTRAVAATAVLSLGVFTVAVVVSDDSAAGSASSALDDEAGLDVITAAADEAETRVSRDSERAPLAATGAGGDNDVMFVSADKTAVRSDAAKDSAALATLKKRAEVQVTGETSGAWTQVLHNELPRWVPTEDLSATEPPLEPEEGGYNDSPCSRMAGIEGGLQPMAVKATRAVCHRFPDIAVYGGRQARGTHGTGHSVDIMVAGERGHEVARFLMARAQEFDLYYLIYEQSIWFNGRGDAWRGMADRGSSTANHYDHVHMTVRGG